MKKVIIGLLVALVLGFGIWNFLIKPPVPIGQVDCGSDAMKYLISSITPKEKLDYLQKYPEAFCHEAFYDCVAQFHTVSGEEKFNKYAEASLKYDAKIGIVYYDLPAVEVANTLTTFFNAHNSCYEKHLSFKLESTLKTAILQEAVYDVNGSCYSAPLLKGIINKLKGNLADATFKCCNALVNGQERVIFKVVTKNGAILTNVGFYDISYEPYNNRILPL